MKIRTYFLLAIVLAFFAGLGYLNRDSASNASQSSPLPLVQQVHLLAAFTTPIEFYGKVVDQYGDSVAEADVYFSANDVPLRDGSKFRVKTDADGRFQLTGAKGISLYVKVTKDGYDVWYSNPGKAESMGSFDYASTGSVNHSPDESNPAVFTLRKREVMEPLEMRPRFKFTIHRDGSSRLISLHGDKNPAHVMALRCISKLDTVPVGEPYDWEFEISIPDGGLVERSDRNLWIAPEQGYKPSDKVVSKSQSRWTEYFKKGYFIRFKDGVHARIELEVYVRDQQLAACKSWMNLKSGSRQLEVASVVPLR